MTTFVNNDVASGDIVYASDHNTQGALLASVLNGGIDNNNLADSGVTTAKIADGAVTPAKLATRVKGGTLTIPGTGNISITGVGFTPQKVEFRFNPGTSAGPAYIGDGWMLADGTQSTRSSYASTGATYRYDSTAKCLSATNNLGVFIHAAFVSMDTNGFTINVTLASGGGTFSWVAEG